MYERFEVRHFRGFDKLQLSRLAKVNLIAGKNNVGKTALLEALFLHAGGYNAELAIRVNALRGIEPTANNNGQTSAGLWQNLFHGLDTEREVQLLGVKRSAAQSTQWEVRLRLLGAPEDLAQVRMVLSQGGKNSHLPTIQPRPVLELRTLMNGESRSFFAILESFGIRLEPLPPPPMLPAFFRFASVPIPQKEVADWFSKLVIEKRQGLILDCLREIDPRLEDIRLVARGGEALLYGDMGQPPLLPLAVMGEGLVRLAGLLLGISSVSGGVALIDEIENGFHYTVLPKLWQSLARVARQFEVQIFATTHSRECIEAAHHAFLEMGDTDFLLHRLERTNGSILVLTYDPEILKAALEAELEVR